MDSVAVIKLIYLVASLLFIFGLKGMSHPRTAVRGNLLGAIGMFLAIATALWLALTDSRFNATQRHETIVLVSAGLGLGSVLGAVLALKVKMTAMPQMVALLNGFGGFASVFVAGADLVQRVELKSTDNPVDVLIAIAASGIIGGVTFSGSLIAYLKLEELKLFRRPFVMPAQQAVNLAVFLILILLTVPLCRGQWWMYAPLAAVSLVLGVCLVNPIGGADMPVVISLLNSYSGIAAAATGFVIDNNVLIISGSLVGASGIILTKLMCKAMNRSLTNVLFGASAGGGTARAADDIYANVRSTSADDVALILDSAQRVVFVPGYGMAVAQAQHAVKNLSKQLEERGCAVEYAIHPVAGRMPGHMNVLLAEADIPYDQMKEMDQINPTMGSVDVAIVIGANDVVNPVARTDPASSIAGMPIIDVDKARTVIVIKRSLSPGFANIPNPLFAAENTLMFYADGQQGVLDIAKAFKEL